MDRANIIHDLLNWIETHLDQPLLLDNVAAKSGYSKWHLQRMFRSTTGHALGSYIRERRLSKAAQALRATPRSILDIALQFHFDSQPSFSRAFKKQFGATPAAYRRTPQPSQTEQQTSYHSESPSLHLLYSGKCTDGKCTQWLGQR
ncbi:MULTISPECIES: helix-turn-helix domain-containing protein [unclassified Serratia (in: enterobacteria)]|uniref:helix-turn-helix domain-containing protein n=1 Tax=unclassified Serratia (in: enterobacteria) TaxID=2647522 RepID=UPI0005056427|nr:MULTISPECIES: helix-turn-helix domain-containing protein [unclassified Serratia (in: enterobacteria)]KFK95631.1 AraC family transcriptional regulator [Serratia sp. Ag2]KFL00355.1 AraC family transcriptional regulator [Serratia sp. Ag1]